MKKIIFASNNKHKLDEMKRIFKPYYVLSLKDIGFNEEIVEDGLTFAENAVIKASAVREFTKDIHRFKDYAVISDDSGLCVKALNYEPGIYSSRYTDKGDEANRQKILEKMININDRTAYFQCFACAILPDGEEFVADGKTYGLISKSKIGDDSFGYDCIFWSDKIRKTFGQATPAEKDLVSHRGIAMKKIKEHLENSGYFDLPEEEEEE